VKALRISHGVIIAPSPACCSDDPGSLALMIWAQQNCQDGEEPTAAPAPIVGCG
jgi:hypothetical protein